MAHIGDSRGYLLRGGELSQLTKDHTFVQSLIDEGRITEEESRDHPHKNLILRAVDAVHDTDPDLFYVELVPGDRVLLCSDGCSGVLDNDRLADILGSESVDYVAVELIRAALEAGSADNVTCVVAEFFDPSAPGEAPAAAGPVVVGAVADLPRRGAAAARSLFRGHRGGDTGEIPPVPGVAADPEELRYALREPRRRPWLRRVAVVLAALVVVAVACTAAYGWSQRQYYVASSGRHVAIFKGVPIGVPGLRMHSVAQTTRVTLASLPAYRAEQVRAGIDADSISDAQDIVARLTGLARVCPSTSPSPSASPSARSNAGPSGKPSGKPTRRASHRATTSASAHPRRQRHPATGSTASASPTRHHRRHQASASPSAAPSQTPSPSPSPTVKPPQCIRGPRS
jgi:protein phosphatase